MGRALWVSALNWFMGFSLCPPGMAMGTDFVLLLSWKQVARICDGRQIVKLRDCVDGLMEVSLSLLRV